MSKKIYIQGVETELKCFVCLRPCETDEHEYNEMNYACSQECFELAYDLENDDITEEEYEKLVEKRMVNNGK